MIGEKLYKRTANGAVQVWWVEVERSKFRMCSGKLDGVITCSEWTVAIPMNMGRSNATTAPQQAVLEAEAAYRKKIKKGYSPELGDAAVRPFSPMLAQEYEDRRNEVTAAFARGDVLVSQPKYDGVRGITRAYGITSRGNTPIVSCPHVSEELAPVFEAFPDLELDGELYSHEHALDFNTIVSLVRKTKPTAEDLELSRQHIKYVVYDVISSAGMRERLKEYSNIVAALDSPTITYAHSTDVHSQKALDLLYESYLENEYEGQMIRFEAPYESRRSPFLLKRKEFIDTEYIVQDIEEGVGNRAGMAGRVYLLIPDTGEVFKSNILGGREFYRELLINKEKYIGWPATCRYQNLTPDGIPRFPRVIAFYPGGRDV